YCEQMTLVRQKSRLCSPRHSNPVPGDASARCISYLNMTLYYAPVSLSNDDFHLAKVFSASALNITVENNNSLLLCVNESDFDETADCIMGHTSPTFLQQQLAQCLRIWTSTWTFRLRLWNLNPMCS